MRKEFSENQRNQTIRSWALPESRNLKIVLAAISVFFATKHGMFQLIKNGKFVWQITNKRILKHKHSSRLFPSLLVQMSWQVQAKQTSTNPEASTLSQMWQYVLRHSCSVANVGEISLNLMIFFNISSVSVNIYQFPLKTSDFSFSGVFVKKNS